MAVSDTRLANARSTMTEQLVGTIRDQILAGKFPPGTPLREEELAREHHVSRHVIREMLRVLAAEGLAEYASYRGARVPQLTEDDVHDIYRARTIIETGAIDPEYLRDRTARLAQVHRDFAGAIGRRDWREAFRLDMDFHAMLVAGAGSERLSRWHGELIHGLRLAHLVAPAFQEEGLPTSVAHHADIALCLAAGDFEGARAALAEHLRFSETLLIEQMRANSKLAVKIAKA